MKIVLISEDYPPTSGGIAQWAYGIVKELVLMGHDVTVLSRENVFRLEEFTYNGERIVKMNSKKWSQFRSVYIAYYTLKEVIKTKPDLIIASTWNIGAFATSIKRFFGFKTVLAYHGLEVTKNLSPKRRFKLIRALKNSDVNIAVSRFTKNEICKKYTVPTDWVSVIHNGVDLARFKPEPKSPALLGKHNLNDEHILLTLSRVIERKGHDVVLRALPEVIKSFPKFKYIIAGVYDQNFYKTLTLLITELCLEDHVIITGVVPSEEILDYYNLCDAYIMVSKGSGTNGDSEGFGITYLEANACEKPVIASETDGIPDAVEHGVNGLLVPPNNVEETSKAILSFLNDPERAKSIGKQGLKRIHQKFTWKKITEHILASINE